MKKLAQGFNTAAQYSNPGSRSRESEGLPLSHYDLQENQGSNPMLPCQTLDSSLRCMNEYSGEYLCTNILRRFYCSVYCSIKQFYSFLLAHISHRWKTNTICEMLL